MSLNNISYTAQKHIQHLLMRHLVPINHKERLAIKYGTKIFANSIPKSGTHLLRRILSMIPNINDRWTYHYTESICHYQKQLPKAMNGQIISAHMYWRDELSKLLSHHGFKTFLVVRDIRDVCVSNAHYLSKDKRHRLHEHFNKLSTWDEKLEAVIRGIDAKELPDGKKSMPISEHVEGFLPWAHDETCLLIRFEELVGEKGGGSNDKQLSCLNRIIEHIGTIVTDDELEQIASRSFSSETKTFRKGQIGSWREEFSDSNIELIKKYAGNQLIELGYEKDLEW